MAVFFAKLCRPISVLLRWSIAFHSKFKNELRGIKRANSIYYCGCLLVFWLLNISNVFKFTNRKGQQSLQGFASAEITWKELINAFSSVIDNFDVLCTEMRFLHRKIWTVYILL